MRGLDALAIRRSLGRHEWGVPQEFGPDGWRLDRIDGGARVIVTLGPADPADDQTDWIHASVSRRDRAPDYEDLTALHAAVWGRDGWSYQVFAPAADHVNIHPYALHLWGLPDGRPLLPNFGALGTI